MPPPEPSLSEQIDAVAEEEALDNAEADVRAGRLISHEATSRWLRSWGTPNELPPPECDA